MRGVGAVVEWGLRHAVRGRVRVVLGPTLVNAAFSVGSRVARPPACLAQMTPPLDQLGVMTCVVVILTTPLRGPQGSFDVNISDFIICTKLFNSC